MPPPNDPVFDGALAAYDRACKRIATACAEDTPAAVGLALARLADALEALPDGRAVDLAALSAVKVRADAERLLHPGRTDPSRAIEAQGALLVTSAVLVELGDVVFAASAPIRASALEAKRLAALVRDDRPLADQRVDVEAALAAAELALGLIEVEAAKAPYAPPAGTSAMR